MSEETKIETMQPFSGQAFRCKNCGALFNAFDYKCPVCFVASKIESTVELGLAAATMSDDDDDVKLTKQSKKNK